MTVAPPDISNASPKRRSLSETVSLLERTRPDLLRELRGQFPEDVILLGGDPAGEEEKAAINHGLDVSRGPQIWAETSLQGLKAYAEESPRLLKILNSRLKLARRLALAGELLTTIASASILAVLGKKSQYYFIAASILALCGVVIGRVAKHMDGDPVTGESISGWFARLVADKPLAAQLKIQLEIELGRPSLDERQIDILVTRTQALSELLNKIYEHCCT